MFKKDSYLSGSVIAAVAVALTFGLLNLLKMFVFPEAEQLQVMKMLLISLVPPMLMMRYFFTKKQFPKSGRGVLIVIVVVGLLTFVFQNSL